MTMFIVLIIIIGIAGFVIMKKKSRANKAAPKEEAGSFPSSPPETTPDQEYTAILASLLALNILLRKDAALSVEMTGRIEAIIDDIMVITPAMMDRYPGDTLTYEIKKIGKTHLYKTVKEYLDLSLDSREKQLGMFEQTIQSLGEVSNRSRDIVEKNETAEFKTMANFLAGKFS